MGSVSQMAILYDEDCGFCRFSVALLLKLDRRRRLRPVAIQAPEGQRLLISLPEQTRLASAHLVGPGDRVHSGGAAIAPVLAELPGAGPLARLAGRLPGASDRGYRTIADHRGWLGRRLPERARRWADATIAARG